MSASRTVSAMPRPGPAAECRCHCGSLLARVVGAAIELKCRRCKRTLCVPLSSSWRAPDAPAAALRGHGTTR